MYIKRVKLENFRNYKSCDVELFPNLNVFVGSNAQGKTNFLESIYLSSIGKSPKTSKDKELIYFGENEAHLRLKKKLNYI